MRAVRFERYGGPEVLEIRDMCIPEPAADEVLVRVHAAGLNPKDAMIRSGGLRRQTGRAVPRGTGFDFAGEVVGQGPGVGDLPLGARVWGFLDGTAGGTAAEYVSVPRSWLASMHDSLAWIEAAALPLVGTAALQALRGVAGLRAGERVLIKGASGGVGSAAIQIANAMGAHVTALTGADAVDHCRALGAHEVLDHRPGPGTLPRRAFDVYLDCAGRSPLMQFGRLLARGGRWVTVAPNLSVYALAPVSTVLAPVLRLPRFGFVVVRPVAADLEELGRLVAEECLRMPISATYRLEDIRAAHYDLENAPSRGKRVLVSSCEAAREAARHGATIARDGVSAPRREDPSHV